MSQDRNLIPQSTYLSPKEIKFLEKKSKQCMRSKADYIRLLVAQDMLVDTKSS